MTSNLPPTISVSLVPSLQTNAPAGSLIGTCTALIGDVSVDNPTWSLGPSTSDGMRIDETGQLLSTVSPLPSVSMTAQIVVTTSDSNSNWLTVPIPLIAMPEIRGVLIEPDQLTISPAGTLVGTLRSQTATTVPESSITYKLGKTDWFTLDGNQLYLAAELPAGTYPATIGVSSPEANQPQEYSITVTVVEPVPPPTLQDEANQILVTAVVEVVSPSSPEIEGSYFADMVHRNNITSIASAINAGLGTPSGTDNFFYPDTDNVGHLWKADNFMAFAKGVMQYIYLVSEVAGGRSNELPSSVIRL